MLKTLAVESTSSARRQCHGNERRISQPEIERMKALLVSHSRASANYGESYLPELIGPFSFIFAFDGASNRVDDSFDDIFETGCRIELILVSSRAVHCSCSFGSMCVCMREERC